jgi:hypothetical protein
MNFFAPCSTVKFILKGIMLVSFHILYQFQAGLLIATYANCVTYSILELLEAISDLKYSSFT